MRYEMAISIRLPREKVIELFDSTENLFKWQEGLKSFDLLEGESGMEGAKSRLVYAGRKGDLVMEECISSRKLPDEFSAIYRAKGVYNEISNHFTEASGDATTWKMTSFFRFRGLMALMAPFMKSAFRANTLLNMERFKAFAEEEGINR